MAVVKRGGTWQVDTYIGGKRHRKGGFKSEGEAEGYEKKTLARLELGLPIEESAEVSKTGPSTTLLTAFERCRERIWKGTSGEEAAWINAEKVMEILGEAMPIGNIAVEHIDLLIEKLRRKGNSDATINRKLAALSRCLTFAVERGWLKSSPKIERLAETQGRLRYLDDAEEAVMLKYFEHFGDPAMYDLCVVLVDTGMRLGELLKLEAKDCDLTAKPKPCIRIWENKADLPRSVPMTARVEKIIRERAKNKVEPRLFSELDHSSVRHRWDRMKLKIGLGGDDQFVPHVLRHTTASRLVQRGVPMKVIQEWLGHRSMVTTMRYAHLAPANLFAAVGALEAVPVTVEANQAHPVAPAA